MFRRFFEEGLTQISYLIPRGQTRQAAAIDTHVHADCGSAV
jgi:hypothetical protein